MALKSGGEGELAEFCGLLGTEGKARGMWPWVQLSFLMPSTQILTGCGGDRSVLEGSLKFGVWSQKKKWTEILEKFCL